jgi:hypothetical protein
MVWRTVSGACVVLQLAKLLQAADAIGDRLRYRHQGFLANKRQLRMGGLAAIELAQMLRTEVRRRPSTQRVQVVAHPGTCRSMVCRTVLIPGFARSAKSLMKPHVLVRSDMSEFSWIMQLSHRRANHPLRVPNDGASGERSASGSHAFGWRDAMDILVRWRQLSEPNDQVCSAVRITYMAK